MDRITEVTRDCFDAIIQLRRTDDASLAAPDVLQKRLCAFVDAAFQRAAQAGFGKEDQNDIVYPIVALADEIAFSRTEAIRAYWADRSLQLHYFHENVAGEAFFTRLQTLRKDPRRREILQLYYVALLLGFQGRYRVRGGELDLMRIVEDLQEHLGAGRDADSAALSPQGDRPDEEDLRKRGPGLALWVAVGALALALLTFSTFFITLRASAGDVVKRVQSIELK
jgi:type VI secretion system protein ImpK